eukprot:gene9505-10507_t
MNIVVKAERGINDVTDNESAERDSAEIDNENDDQDSQKSEEGIGTTEPGQNHLSAQQTKSQPKVKAKDGLRKGKWTPEEEKYTNKVIEVFNAGLLKLPDTERGITLRAYLAEKLGCDPMRITKKYTGASCLGKRVYHFDYLNANHEAAEKARAELEMLETNFRVKLEQMNRRRSNDPSLHVEHSRIVSTPAIDALMQRNRIAAFPVPAAVPRPEEMAAYPFQPHPFFFQALPPGPPPQHHTMSTNGAPSHHPHQMAPHGYDLPRAGLYSQIVREVSGEPMHHHHNPHALHQQHIPHYKEEMIPLSAGGMSSKAGGGHLPPHTAGFYPQYPHPMMAQYFMPPPPMYGHFEGHIPPQLAHHGGLPMRGGPGQMLPQEHMLPPNGQHLQKTSAPTSSHAPPSSSASRPTGPTSGVGSVNLSQPMNSMFNFESSVNSQYAPMPPMMNKDDVRKSNGEDCPIAAAAAATANALPAFMTSVAPIVHTHSRSKEKRVVEAVPEEDLVKKKVKISESDQNAATSLLGFINHLQKIGSQEDLVDFFEGVQKASHLPVKSPNSKNGEASPPGSGTTTAHTSSTATSSASNGSLLAREGITPGVSCAPTRLCVGSS